MFALLQVLLLVRRRTDDRFTIIAELYVVCILHKIVRGRAYEYVYEHPTWPRSNCSWYLTTRRGPRVSLAAISIRDADRIRIGLGAIPNARRLEMIRATAPTVFHTYAICPSLRPN